MTSLASPKQSNRIRQLATKELALITGFLFFGYAILPIAVYHVGEAVFGAYAGVGYGDFFGTLSAKIRNGDFAAWFLISSPYLGWQILRILAFFWRRTGSTQAAS